MRPDQARHMRGSVERLIDMHPAGIAAYRCRFRSGRARKAQPVFGNTMDVAAVTERDLRHLIWHREQMLDRRWVIEQGWQNRVRMGDLIGNGRQAMPFGKGDIRKPL